RDDRGSGGGAAGARHAAVRSGRCGGRRGEGCPFIAGADRFRGAKQGVVAQSSSRREPAMRIEEDGGVSPAVALSPAARAPVSKNDRLIARAQGFPPPATPVVPPCGETSPRRPGGPAPPPLLLPLPARPRARIT